LAENTLIEWTEATWNPITGCTKISRGCQHCYAERMAYRLAGRYGYPADEPFKITLHPQRLGQPLKWKKPHVIFVCSMSDLFHKDVPDSFIFEILNVIRQAPQHIFQILTKRSARMLKISQQIGEWLPNVWLGITVEAEEYKKRIDNLRKINCSVRFISCEPLLEDLGEINFDGIDWVIVGGESGPKSRIMRTKWAVNIRDQCLHHNVAYFFKQWGGMNKKAAGRRLEGKEWNQFPKTIRVL